MSIVETRSGKVESTRLNGVHAFLGIPFAAPPVGERRWQPPLDAQPWSGVRRSSDYAPQAWQPVMEAMGPLAFAFNARSAANRDEDCLYLNVWTPGLDDRKRPVLVWIHGGGFSSGTGGTPMYAGTSLAQRGDAVVVTVNYRLGALGFVNLNEVTGGRIPATGNEGLLDQVKALEWVRDNIERFGGDPGRVTIFGESAGGMSVGALLAFEPAAGLFHRAIPQSGACSTANPLDKAAGIGQAILDALGVSANAPAEDLLAVSPERLVEAGVAAGVQAGGAMIYQPCVDGTLLTDLPLGLVEGGVADGIDLMVGATRDEWRLFLSMPGFEVKLDDATLEQVLGATIGDPQAVIGAYRSARAARGDATDANSLFAAIETDRIFRIPAIRLAEAVAGRGRDAYEYLFTWESPWGDGGLGSPHAIDIGFVFGTHGFSEGSAEFFGSGPDAETLTGVVQDAWLKFATDGDPQTEALTGWRPYDTETRSTALFGMPVAVGDDPYGEERAAWDEVEARLGTL
ncbi:MAG: carboxylesterase/lipase family protein [Gammaproteobacteria bacterium]|nr:carboxylesterase/lipase family protein [Gammaproteobacteria bacterium]